MFWVYFGAAQHVVTQWTAACCIWSQGKKVEHVFWAKAWGCCLFLFLDSISELSSDRIMSHYDCNIRSASPAASAEKTQAHTMVEQQSGHGGVRMLQNRFPFLWNTQIFILSKKEIAWLRVDLSETRTFLTVTRKQSFIRDFISDLSGLLA